MLIADIPPHHPAYYLTEACTEYRVPCGLLAALLITEGGKPGSRVGPNRNGTWDLGPMQINTVWLDRLEEMGITEKDLVEDWRTNLRVAAWILRNYYDELGTWDKAIRAYNTGYLAKIGKGGKYARKVLSAWSCVLRYSSREGVVVSAEAISSCGYRLPTP